MRHQIKISLTTHLPAIAKCHQAAFPTSLASALGRRYCTHMLSWYLSSEKTFLFHIEDEQGCCAGYCGGMVNDGNLGTGSASGMAQYSFYPAIWAFIMHPWVIFHAEVRAKWSILWKNIKMKLGLAPKIHTTSEKRRQQAREPQVGLVVIGVGPAYQGKRVGSALLQEFERRATEVYGISKLQLTVRADNNQAIRAYEKNGWVREKSTDQSLTMMKICK